MTTAPPDRDPTSASHDSAEPSRPGPSGGTELFRERMTPGASVLLVMAAFGLVFGVVLVPLSTTLALVVAIAGALAMCAVSVVTSPVLRVSREEVRFGRARISPDLLGDPTILRGEDWKESMGTGFRPLEFHCTRGWMRAGLRVPVLDESDPTPAWHVSSRRPEDLALALRSARQA